MKETPECIAASCDLSNWEAEKKLLLDFTGVSFMSSAMIGKLVLLHKKCKSAEILMKVCNISNRNSACWNTSGLLKACL